MLGLKTHIKTAATHLWRNRRVLTGAGCVVGAMHLGAIDPETAKAIGIGFYTAWMSTR